MLQDSLVIAAGIMLYVSYHLLSFKPKSIDTVVNSQDMEEQTKARKLIGIGFTVFFTSIIVGTLLL